MYTYIALLRGINVSGKNKLKMSDLRNMLISLHFNAVETYIQSGNCIFKSDETDISLIENKIAHQIYVNFGLDIPVLVISQKELENCITQNPYLETYANQTQKLYLTLLKTIPTKELYESVHKLSSLTDECFISGKYIYLVCHNGYGKTKLTNSFFEKKLKVIATTRNWNSLQNLLTITLNRTN